MVNAREVGAINNNVTYAIMKETNINLTLELINIAFIIEYMEKPGRLFDSFRNNYRLLCKIISQGSNDWPLENDAIVGYQVQGRSIITEVRILIDRFIRVIYILDCYKKMKNVYLRNVK